MDNLLISSPENHRSLDPHMAIARKSIGTCGQFLRKLASLSGENRANQKSWLLNPMIPSISIV